MLSTGSCYGISMRSQATFLLAIAMGIGISIAGRKHRRDFAQGFTTPGGMTKKKQKSSSLACSGVRVNSLKKLL